LATDQESRMLEALQDRQRQACEAFVDAHYRGVLRFFLWLIHDTEVASDLTQETFAAFWASIDHLDAAAVPDLKAWLFGIARNRWRKWCRGRRPPDQPLEEALEVADTSPGPEALALTAFETEAVVRAVADLPADYREALILRVFQELTYRQIADALLIREELARWRVHRARLWLRTALEVNGKKEEARAAIP
jgi:RNA polymerase sigma-70 factor, ECF subfamily